MAFERPPSIHLHHTIMYAFDLCSFLGSLLLISSGQSLTLLLCFPLLTRILLFCCVVFIAGIFYCVGRLLSTIASFLLPFSLFLWLLLLTLRSTSLEFVEICFFCTVLSEVCSDESSELSLHQMAHPTRLRTRLPS